MSVPGRDQPQAGQDFGDDRSAVASGIAAQIGAREQLRRAAEDGERLYRIRQHGEHGETVADGNRIDGILTRELDDALGAFDMLLRKLAAAGVSGGTPHEPSETDLGDGRAVRVEVGELSGDSEREQCQRCNSDDWTEWMDYRGCSDCRDLAGEDAEDAAAKEACPHGTPCPDERLCACSLVFAPSGALCKRSPRQPEGQSWTGPICACDASEWLKCRRGTTTGSARLPEPDLDSLADQWRGACEDAIENGAAMKEWIYANKVAPLERSVGRLEEALRAAFESTYWSETKLILAEALREQTP